jgi:hypothetical protein
LKTPDEFVQAMKERGSHPPKRPEGPFVISAAKNTKPDDFFWPQITNLEQAIRASDAGFAASLIIVAVNTVLATISVVQHTAILGINVAGYIDAGFFGLIAWGIRCRSRVAAIAGLSLFAVEKIYQFATQPNWWMGLMLTFVLLAFFVSGVRGTFAYRRFASTVAKEMSAGQGT